MIFRQSTPIPQTGPAGPVGVNRVHSIPFRIPTDVTSVKLNGANRRYDSAAGSSVVLDHAMYRSDGTGDPTGSSFSTLTGRTIPGDGTFYSSPSIAVTRGTDNKIVPLFSFPNPVFVSSPNTDIGKYADATTTVDPPPVWTSGSGTSVFWWELEYDTAKRPFVVLCDSNGVGYSGISVGFKNAAWNLLADANDWAVDIRGVVQFGSLQHFADTGTYPYLHDRQSYSGSDAVIQLGTNDLNYNNLATMQASLISLIAYVKSRGVKRIYAWTVPPQTSFPGTDTVRTAYNSWLLSVYVSLGITGVYNAAAAQSAGGVADNSNPNILFAAYDSGDGTHLSLAGQQRVRDGWALVVAIPQTKPLSWDRVMAALRRISPPWPSTADDTSVGLELGSIGVALGKATDILDSLLDELLPDTTTQLLDRWEGITRVATRVGDDLDTRRARVLAVLRRTNGPRLSQLAAMLAGPLDLDPADIMFVEQLRSFIEQALLMTTGTVSLAVPITPPDLQVALGNPYWPGIVDDGGVSVYLKLSALNATHSVTMISPKGTSSIVPVTAAEGWYSMRTAFLGERAAGKWTLSIRDSGAPTLQEMRIIVSNDVDSGAIYNFFAFRDPLLAGTPDLFDAQRLFHRTALANMRAFVTQSMGFTVGSQYSLVGRDPIGGA